MPASVNIIRNPRFSEGRTGPSRWVFDATESTASWSRGVSEPGAAADGMTVECHHREGSALWSQVVVCAPGEYYRLEAVVTGDLDAADETAGLVLARDKAADSLRQNRSSPTLIPASEAREETLGIGAKEPGVLCGRMSASPFSVDSGVCREPLTVRRSRRHCSFSKAASKARLLVSNCSVQ